MHVDKGSTPVSVTARTRCINMYHGHSSQCLYARGTLRARAPTLPQVSLMTEQLTWRQREQRAAAKSHKQHAMHLRPTTAEKRRAYHNSFAAFLAAQEAAAAVGVAAGAGQGAAALEAAAFVEAG